MKLLRKIETIFDYGINFLALLSVILIVFVMLAITFEVCMRYFLNRPMVWMMEVTEYALLFITFLATAWVLRNEGHVKMELVIDRLSHRTQNQLNAITSIISAIVCLVITCYGLKVTWGHFQIGYIYSGSLEWPAFLLVAVIPVGTFLLFIQFLRRAYQYLSELKPR